MVTDFYPTVLLDKFDGRPIGKANFKEPVFKLGIFQNRYIDVVVVVYSGEIEHPQSGHILVPVRFGEMNVIRFVDKKLLDYNAD